MAEAMADRVDGALRWLERKGTKRNREGMARYGIVAPKVFGVSMATMQTLARHLGKDHALALALWDTRWYEARMLAESGATTERWVGKNVLRDLLRPQVSGKIESRGRKRNNSG